MNKKSSTANGKRRGEVFRAGLQEAPPFFGEIVSRSHEPPPGWRGSLVEMLPNALVFRTDEDCQPLLPTLLPAFCLLPPALPDSPGSARVSWVANSGHSQSSAGSEREGPWIPAAMRIRLRPGLLLEHAVFSGETFFRLEGIARILQSPGAARPRLVLAPPRRGSRLEVERAILRSLYRAVHSMPPDSDLQRLLAVSRAIIAFGRSGSKYPALSALPEVVGFGDGRTARGDDYLVGFICGVDLASSIDTRIDPNRFHEFRSSLMRAIDRRIENTTLLGRHVIRAAFHGLYSAPLLEEADALSDGIVVGPGEPEWTLVHRPTVSPGWSALLGLLTGAYFVGSVEALPRDVDAPFE